jgi:hypothetical protein
MLESTAWMVLVFSLGYMTCGIVPTSRLCRLLAEVADLALFGGELRLRLAT